MSDEQFLQQFEAGLWPLDQWHHEQHIKLAYLYLRRYRFDDALARAREKIKAHNLVHQVPEGPASGYHETMTHAWMSLVHLTLCEYGAADDAGAFYARSPQLAEKKILRLFYSRERFVSPEAKLTFVTPDLTSLPESRRSPPPLL